MPGSDILICQWRDHFFFLILPAPPTQQISSSDFLPFCKDSFLISEGFQHGFYKHSFSNVNGEPLDILSEPPDPNPKSTVLASWPLCFSLVGNTAVTVRQTTLRGAEIEVIVSKQPKLVTRSTSKRIDRQKEQSKTSDPSEAGNTTRVLWGRKNVCG